ncbi:Transcriptional regulator [Kosakonia quasisacchari]
MINIPELELLLLALFMPPTELTGAGALVEFEHPASQSETSDNAATRLTVNFGLPALIYPPTICKLPMT